MIYLGIDPGLNGALAVVDEHGAAIDSLTMPRVNGSTGPMDLLAVYAWLLEWRGAAGSAGACAALEDLQGRVNAKMGGRSALTMGRNHGRLEALLLAQGWRYQMPQPQRWQKPMHSGCLESKDPKARSIMAARRLLPSLDLTPGRRVKPHDGLADAGLLALYARRTMGGAP